MNAKVNKIDICPWYTPFNEKSTIGIDRQGGNSYTRTRESRKGACQEYCVNFFDISSDVVKTMSLFIY